MSPKDIELTMENSTKKVCWAIFPSPGYKLDRPYLYVAVLQRPTLAMMEEVENNTDDEAELDVAEGCDNDSMVRNSQAHVKQIFSNQIAMAGQVEWEGWLEKNGGGLQRFAFQARFFCIRHGNIEYWAGNRNSR